LDGVRDALLEAEASPMKVSGSPLQGAVHDSGVDVGFRLGPDNHEIAQKWDDDCYGVWETVTEFITNRDPEVLEVIEMAARKRLPVFGCAPMASEATIGGWPPPGCAWTTRATTPKSPDEERAGIT